ncbi:radical SAM protein [Psychrilyobacter atlanticus]|uniref:radical SAM protein n=1 Tax=Psychrilyobacter atlanticus TaxID=271091 RepID=UPI00041A9FBF|nr:radical SAM protein [Psychrilyobacter atlanticus]
MRYNKVLDKNIREIVLLKSFPCSYGKCKFCNYIEDNSIDEREINQVNFDVLKEVTGEFGVLEVINSGSVFEIPFETLKKIREVVREKKIKVLYFEAYYGYIKRLDEIRDYFDGTEIRFRIGVETFDDNYRIDSYGKNFVIDENTLKKLSNEFYSACLLVCTVGQTEEMITKDIETGLANFKQITINVFIDNGTEVKQDKELVNWLMENYSYLKADPRVELLYDNKDLGVFEQ